jgi:hypothetical protein
LAAGFFAAAFFGAAFFFGFAAVAASVAAVTFAAGTDPARRDAVLLFEAVLRPAAAPRFLRVSLMIECLDLICSRTLFGADEAQ